MNSDNKSDETLGPIAPRTPETNKVYQCLNEVNSEAKLANDIALNALNAAKAIYD